MDSDHLIGEQPLRPIAHARRDWPYRRSATLRYGVAVLAVAAGFAIRYLAYGDLMNRLVFTFFVPAAMVAAWYGGLGPGILATMLGMLLGDYFFIPPRFALWPLGIRESLGVGAYAVTTLLCVMLCERLHQHIREFEHALEYQRQHRTGGLPTAAREFADYLARYYAQAASQDYAYSRWPFRRPFAARYGLTIVAVITAFGLRYWLFGTQDYRLPFIFFVPASIVAAWYGGMAPGLLATLAGLMLGDYFFLSDHEALGPVRENERLAIGMYAVTTTLCVMLFENLHDRIRRLEHALDHSLHHRPKLHPDTPASADKTYSI
jgi:K+-sensing histidine kinase KdpD